MSSHTQGKLKIGDFNNPRVVHNENDIVVVVFSGNFPIQLPEDACNARRFVALWNATLDLSVEEIERNGLVIGGVENVDESTKRDNEKGPANPRLD